MSDRGFLELRWVAWRAGNLDYVGERACTVGLHNLYKDALICNYVRLLRIPYSHEHHQNARM
jgi:hypothetical protein